MRKNTFFKIIMAMLMPIIIFSCKKEVDPPQPDFYASQLSSSQITFAFTDLSSNSPDEWIWTFEGGTPSTSTMQNPTVTYSSPGTYSVTLIARNEGGQNETMKYNYINVVQFNNTLFTDVYISVDGITKTMSPDYSVLFADVENTSISYTAETYGETTGGTIIGEELYWDNTVDLTSFSSYNLVTYDYIFFYITNYCGYSLNPFYVNYNTYDETMDDIVIPSDGVTYETGYYYANYAMEIRAYYQYYSTYYVAQWFIYPDYTSNQWRNLTFYGKSEKRYSDKALDFSSVESEMLYPVVETGSKKVLDPNAKNLANTNKK